MAARTRTPRSHDETRNHRRLRDQPVAFLGLFLMPFAGLLLTWAIHAYLYGFTAGSWHLTGSPKAAGITLSVAGAAGLALTYQAYSFAEHRRPALRQALAMSVSIEAVMVCGNIGAGPDRWWGFAFVLCSWWVALMWSFTRLNVLRQDPREPEEKESILDKIGLGGWSLRKVRTDVDPATGEPTATHIAATHAPGAVFDDLGHALPNIESLAGAPSGLSSANRTDAANRSELTIQHKDMLAGPVPLGPLSHPGGSITDPIMISIYQDGTPSRGYLGGGQDASPNPTGFGIMGMSRSGKGVAEALLFTEIISRRDVVTLYLNQAKGKQDIRPIIPGIAGAVIAEQASDGVAEYVAALAMVSRIIQYRQSILADFNKSSWDASCWSNPPKRRLPDGTLVQMPKIPALIVYVGEADTILERGGEAAQFVSSKGLSCGVIAGYSLQRASAEFMPTGLRYNIGAWWCFGVGDEVSASFVLTDAVLNAGAHPEYWKADKPGYHYFVGPGVPDDRRAKMLKTFSGSSRAGLQDELLRRNLENAPHMAKLDQGSIDATRYPNEPESRWDVIVRNTDRIRNDLLGGTANMTADDRNPAPATAPVAAYVPPATAPAFDNHPHREGESPEELRVQIEFDEDFAEDVAGVTEVEGVRLYPDLAEGLGVDPVVADDSGLAPPPAEGEDLEFPEDKPDPPDRDTAIRMFHTALRELADDPGVMRDDTDPTGNTKLIRTSDIYGRYPFKSRPWFSGELAALADGKRTPPPSLSLERADDLPLASGYYRLRRVPDSDGR